jgi:hypothetical protein
MKTAARRRHNRGDQASESPCNPCNMGCNISIMVMPQNKQAGIAVPEPR